MPSQGWLFQLQLSDDLAQAEGPVVIGSTSAPGQEGMLAQWKFVRRFSPAPFLDQAAFGVMTLPFISIPLILQ